MNRIKRLITFFSLLACVLLSWQPAIANGEMKQLAVQNANITPQYMAQESPFIVRNDPDTITIKANTALKIVNAGVHKVFFAGESDLIVDIDDNLDTGAIAVGTDYYIYLCDEGNATASVIISGTSTFPTGYTADNSDKIGGFHTLCVSVGTIAGHTLTGEVAGAILPASVWDLSHRPISEPEGMVYSDKANIWVDIYLANTTDYGSTNGGTIKDTVDWMTFVDGLGALNKQLLSDDEFQNIAAGSNEETNIVGSADPVTTGGHSDTAGRRMISNIGVEDACGAMWQWLRDQAWRYDNDFTMQAASKTCLLYHAASPGGNPIYVKFDTGGNPYLACNMATDAVDKWLTFGSAYTVLIKHEADPSAGTQVYFDEDATQPSRLLSALPGLKDVYIPTSNPNCYLKITYNADPSTPGVAISYDDGTDERVEFISPTSANGTLDTAVFGLTWGYYNLPGTKGSLYKQGTYGDTKLLAGGGWVHGTYCGSRSRDANSSRWNAHTSLGGRGRSEPR